MNSKLIIFLADTFPEKKEEEILQELEESSDSSCPSEEELDFPYEEPLDVDYEALPDFFISLETWPKSTNLYCWQCDCPFTGIPWIIPVNLVRKLVGDNEVNAYKRHGVFCGLIHLNDYIEDHPLHFHNLNMVKKLLEDYIRIMMGKEVIIIPRGLDKYVMVQYVGPSGITPQEYRRRMDNLTDRLGS